MLIYDGIHYDALALAAEKGSPEAADFTVFEVGPEADLADMKARSDVMQEESGLSSRVPARQARSFVAEQNKQRQFTDTGNFTLRSMAGQWAAMVASLVFEIAVKPRLLHLPGRPKGRGRCSRARELDRASELRGVLTRLAATKLLVPGQQPRRQNCRASPSVHVTCSLRGTGQFGLYTGSRWFPSR